jgi:hypothetical protein
MPAPSNAVAPLPFSFVDLSDCVFLPFYPSLTVVLNGLSVQIGEYRPRPT